MKFSIFKIMEAVIAKTEIRRNLETAWEEKKAVDLAYFDWYAQTRPSDVPLADEDILEEVYAVRYGKK